VKIASSLAAAIEKVFGTEAVLQEGHNGILEVKLNGKKIFTNEGKCGCLPVAQDIIQKIIEHDGKPVVNVQTIDIENISCADLSCPLPPEKPLKGTK
jgi:hypothetical protein